MNVKTKLFENIIEDYKNKIQNLIAANETAFNQIKEQEEVIKEFHDIDTKEKKVIKEMSVEKQNLYSQLNNLKESLDNEIKNKVKFEEKYKLLLETNKVICTKLEQLYKNEINLYESHLKYATNVNSFFIMDN
jgi:hypothetical protein